MDVVKTAVFPKLNSQKYPSPCWQCNKSEEKIYVCAICTIATYCSGYCSLIHSMDHFTQCAKWERKLEVFSDHNGNPLEPSKIICCGFDKTGDILETQLLASNAVNTRKQTLTFEISNNELPKQPVFPKGVNIVVDDLAELALEDRVRDNDWVDVAALTEILNSKS